MLTPCVTTLPATAVVAVRAQLGRSESGPPAAPNQEPVPAPTPAAIALVATAFQEKLSWMPVAIEKAWLATLPKAAAPAVPTAAAAAVASAPAPNVDVISGVIAVISVGATTATTAIAMTAAMIAKKPPNLFFLRGGGGGGGGSGSVGFVSPIASPGL